MFTFLSADLKFASVGLVAALFLLAIVAPGCERSEESFRQIRNAQASNPNPPTEQTANLIKRLEGAKELDLSEANRADISPVPWEDATTQAGKANKVIKELSYGIKVSQPELEDALWVPPASLSTSERSRLINQVKQAIRSDHRQEQAETVGANMGNYPYPINTMAALEDHKQMAEGVLKDLETGEDVHWQTLQQATKPLQPED